MHRRVSWARSEVARSRSDRILTGVAGGLGERLGVDSVVVRLAFAVLAFAGGVGVVLYLLLWVVMPNAPAEPRPAPSGSDRGGVLRKTMALALVVGGSLLLLRAAGIWFGDAVVWPVALGAFGSAVIWARAGESGRARLSGITSRLPRNPIEAAFAGPVSRVRVLVGALLIAGGMFAFLAANGTFAAIRGVAFAVVVTATGAALILGPGMWRLVRQVSDERRERIRQEERAEMAAHLHDSVLQSLAMIQRASTAKEAAGLARGQERELRSWLYGRTGVIDHDLLSSAVEETAARIEAIYHVKVEVVVVGDRSMDERLLAVVQATGEAMTNAARHAGVATVSVYVEVEPDGVTAYVRDQGKGFEQDRVPEDRLGIADSIRGRMGRAGGTATIETAPGHGTEVELRLPRERE